MTAISRRLVLAAALVLGTGTRAGAAAALGAPAPAFRTLDADGRERTLAEFAGRIVVLEWTSSDCPYSRKHYGSGTMQALQTAAVRDGEPESLSALVSFSVKRSSGSPLVVSHHVPSR